MFTTSRQLGRYQNGLDRREREDEARGWFGLFVAVVIFVLVLDIAYRLSSII